MKLQSSWSKFQEQRKRKNKNELLVISILICSPTISTVFACWSADWMGFFILPCAVPSRVRPEEEDGVEGVLQWGRHYHSELTLFNLAMNSRTDWQISHQPSYYLIVKLEVTLCNQSFVFVITINDKLRITELHPLRYDSETQNSHDLKFKKYENKLTGMTRVVGRPSTWANSRSPTRRDMYGHEWETSDE